MSKIQSDKQISDAYKQGLVLAVALSNTILFSDIDNTFICHEGHASSLTASSNELLQQLHTRNFGVVLITGAAWSNSTTSGGTPGVVQRLGTIIPDNVHAIFTSGGLEAYVRTADRKFVRDTLYSSFIQNKRATFNQSKVEAAGEAFIKRMKLVHMHLELSSIQAYDIVKNPFSDIAIFQYQAKGHQEHTSGKVSMFAHASNSEELTQLTKIAHEYAEQCNAICVVCEEKDINNRLMRKFNGNPPIKRYNVDFTFLDKSVPIEYLLATQLKGDSQPQCVVAGDAGNDSPLFLSPHTTHGIIVGGAAKELEDQKEIFLGQDVKLYVEKGHHIGPDSMCKALAQFFPLDPFQEFTFN